MPSCFIGVDGGGTSTDLVLIDEKGSLVHSFSSQASNWNSTGKEKAKHVLIDSISELMKDRIQVDQVGAICLSLSGIHSREDKEIVKTWMSEILQNTTIIVENDVVAALASGTAGKLEGITCIAGTGMNCYGRLTSGKEASAGGMGPLLGDRGSGQAIGQEALDVCARANDCRVEDTALLPALLDRLECSRFEELIPWRYSPDCANDVVASLALVVFECASKGDKAAKKIVNDASNELFEAIKAVVHFLDLSESAFTLVLAGSLWKNETIIQVVSNKAAELWKSVNIVVPDISGARGAALVAKNFCSENA
mmetsp:Transcript_27842/g.42630  ORF Transcript_27842/g.42630 Transcript_27842/m.42630 type:complete len:310 (-) Transcript_27842:3500-4429(-)